MVKNYCKSDFVVLQTRFKQLNEPRKRKTQLLVLWYVLVHQKVLCRKRSILDSHMCRLKNKTTAETSSCWELVKDLYLVTQILQMQWCRMWRWNLFGCLCLWGPRGRQGCNSSNGLRTKVVDRHAHEKWGCAIVHVRMLRSNSPASGN